MYHREKCRSMEQIRFFVKFSSNLKWRTLFSDMDMNSTAPLTLHRHYHRPSKFEREARPSRGSAYANDV